MDDNHYISEVLSGRTDAFAILIDRHKDMVFTIAMNITRNREDAEEVAQDAFLKAFRKLSDFRQDAGFKTWLYRIAYNEAISRVRKNKVVMLDLEEELTGNIPDESSEDDLAGLDEQAQKMVVQSILASLPEIDRVIITLFYLESHPVTTIAEITGLGESNVKVRLHRARKRIYSALQHILKIKSLSL